ncbi:hypothetical protein FRB96_006763 [Tulasnella sp. 330]|nr:hypothetical protein FRB96_006763 [Tulasnella sp. 330]KAG8875290.1 hypothetical protein FRB98_007996 [Tulasnella sp. 332]
MRSNIGLSVVAALSFVALSFAAPDLKAHCDVCTLPAVIIGLQSSITPITEGMSTALSTDDATSMGNLLNEMVTLISNADGHFTS